MGHFNSFCVSVELGGRPLDNVRGVPQRGGTAREPLPNATQARIDTYQRRILTSFDTNQLALFVQSTK